MTLKQTFAPVLACILVAGLSSALPASATEWMAWQGQDADAPQVIYTQDTDQRGVMLTCQANGDLSSAITLSPGSLPELLAKNAPYGRSADATISVGAQASEQAKFRYVPAIDLVEIRSHAFATKVFNAAVLGEPLNIDMQRETDIQASLPAPDTAFKAFAKTCKALREQSED
jgi:hypothetical protein